MKDIETRGRGALVAAAGVVASALCMPLPALAEESSSGASLLVPKMGEFLPALIAFLVVFFLLKKLAWPAIIGMLDKREQTIKDQLAQAEANRIESERILAEHKAQMEEARVESAEIIANAKDAGEAMRAEITSRAQQEADDMIAKATAAIEGQKQEALQELQSSVADITVSVAGRLIGENLTNEEHLKLVKRYVEEAGDLNAN